VNPFRTGDHAALHWWRLIDHALTRLPRLRAWHLVEEPAAGVNLPRRAAIRPWHLKFFERTAFDLLQTRKPYMEKTIQRSHLPLIEGIKAQNTSSLIAFNNLQIDQCALAPTRHAQIKAGSCIFNNFQTMKINPPQAPEGLKSCCLAQTNPRNCPRMEEFCLANHPLTPCAVWS
jgi:hypothetical protein